MTNIDLGPVLTDEQCELFNQMEGNFQEKARAIFEAGRISGIVEAANNIQSFADAVNMPLDPDGCVSCAGADEAIGELDDELSKLRKKTYSIPSSL